MLYLRYHNLFTFLHLFLLLKHFFKEQTVFDLIYLLPFLFFIFLFVLFCFFSFSCDLQFSYHLIKIANFVHVFIFVFVLGAFAWVLFLLLLWPVKTLQKCKRQKIKNTSMPRQTKQWVCVCVCLCVNFKERRKKKKRRSDWKKKEDTQTNWIELNWIQMELRIVSLKSSLEFEVSSRYHFMQRKRA